MSSSGQSFEPRHSPGASVDAAAFKTLRFSTDEFPLHKRIEAYREIYGRSIVRYDVEPIGGHPFHFKAAFCTLPGLTLASSLISPCRRSRGAGDADGDDLILGIAVSGGCDFHQCGRAAVVGDGEAVLTSGADAAIVVNPSPSQRFSLKIPSSALRPMIGDFDGHLLRPVSRATAALRMLTGYIDAIRGDELAANRQLRDLFVAHVHDLVGLLLGSKGESRELAEQRGGRAARRVAVLRLIDDHSADQTLSAGKVAKMLGVTPRYVHLLLEETGKSFTHHLLERRLKKAAALLRDSQWDGWKVTEVAAEAGFTDLSYFSRAFRRRYGATPSDIRESARRGRAAQN